MCVWISIAALFSNFVGTRSVCECKFLHHHNPLPAEEGVANYESILIFRHLKVCAFLPRLVCLACLINSLAQEIHIKSESLLKWLDAVP